MHGKAKKPTVNAYECRWFFLKVRVSHCYSSAKRQDVWNAVNPRHEFESALKKQQNTAPEACADYMH